MSLMIISWAIACCSCTEIQQVQTTSVTPQHTISVAGDTVSKIGGNIDCIFQDRQGNYWFGSNGEGVYRYDGNTITHITQQHGLCSDFVWNIQEDINGRLWFSSRDGFCSFEGSFFKDQTALIENATYGKLAYTKGGLFFSHKNGICFYNGVSFMNFVIHPEFYQPAANNQDRPYAIYSTLVDQHEKVWFGTQSQGVCLYDGESFSYLTDKNLAGYAVRALFEDRNGNFWFGNNGGGLFKYDGKSLTNITEENGLENPEFLKGNSKSMSESLARVWSITDDKDGNLWIATIDAGAWMLTGSKLTHYNTKNGLTGNAIWTIFRDRSGQLWFVVEGKDVFHFNGNGFTRYEFNEPVR